MVSMVKLTTLTCCLAVAGAVTLVAQSSTTTTKTKIEVKDGQDMKVTGCVVADPSGGGRYVLTHVTDKGGALHRYNLVSDTEDFSMVIGHRVQIEGKVADREHGKVEIKSETKIDGPGKDTSSEAEGSGPFLGVKHLKTIAASCP